MSIYRWIDPDQLLYSDLGVLVQLKGVTVMEIKDGSDLIAHIYTCRQLFVKSLTEKGKSFLLQFPIEHGKNVSERNIKKDLE